MANDIVTITLTPPNMSTFEFKLGGDIGRVLTYTGGTVSIPEVSIPTVISLDRFERLADEVLKWLDLLVPVIITPELIPAYVQIDFGIGPKVGTVFNTNLDITFNQVTNNHPVTFSFIHSNQDVTFIPRVEALITYSDFKVLNKEARGLVKAARTGKRFD